jgi:hypothetical protein
MRSVGRSSVDRSRRVVGRSVCLGRSVGRSVRRDEGSADRSVGQSVSRFVVIDDRQMRSVEQLFGRLVVEAGGFVDKASL